MKKCFVFGVFLGLMVLSTPFARADETVELQGSEYSGKNIVSVDSGGFVHVSEKCGTIARITSNVTALVIKNAPGVLHQVTVGRKGANSNITLWDNATAASGFILASLDTASVNQTYILDEVFLNGLVATTSAPTLTVSADADVVVCTT